MEDVGLSVFIVACVFVILCLVVISLLAFGYFILYLRNIRSKYVHLPGPPLDSWLLGHLPSIQKKRKYGKILHQILHEWSLEYGEVFLVWFMHIPYVIAIGPEHIKKVIVTLNLPKPKANYNDTLYHVYNSRLMGKGLVTECDTQIWLRQRMALNPAFHRKYLLNFIEKFNSSCDRLVLKLGGLADKKIAVDLAEELHRVTMDIIGKVGFNMDLKAVDDNDCPFLTANYQVLKGIQNSLEDMFWKVNFPTFPYQWKVKKAVRFVRETGQRIIEERIADIQSGKDCPNDILQHIVHMKANNPSVTMEGMVDEFVTFFLAGQETTSNLLAFTIFEIEKHEDIKKRIVKEVDVVLEGNPFVTHNHIPKLEYLQQTLKEGLRIHPPIQGFPRINTKEIELNGHIIPKDSPIELSIWGSQRSSKYWYNPDVFDPERFASTNSNNFDANFPFSLGPRACIGKNFAQIEAKIILARLYQEFDFELVSDKPLQYEEATTLRPMYGVLCRVKRRR